MKHTAYTARAQRVHSKNTHRSRILTHVIAIGLTAPVAAFAQDGPETFSLPAGCTAYLTVQGTSCTVDHHFTCDGDPEGEKRRVSLTEEGMSYMGAVDNETQWINSYHAFSGHFEQLEADPVDRASLTELIETGIDTYDFKTVSDEIGVTRFVGQDNLTGRKVTFDGITLDETQYNITAYDDDGSVMWSSTGNEYISRDWRIFLSGTDVITTPTDTFETDDRPVEFIFPGEPGFLSANPKHGCGLVLSSAPLLSRPEENEHDDL